MIIEMIAKMLPKRKQQRIQEIKEDLDFWASRPEHTHQFPKGFQNYTYFSKFVKLFFGKNCFRYILYYRLNRYSRLLSCIFRVPYDSTQICYGNIEGGAIYMNHAFSTILNCEHIGKGCVFLQNTTFGNKRKNGKLVRPYLESNVIVGANVTCIGGVHIGNNVTIGAGSVVTKSIPDNCTVVGNPARIVFLNGKRVDKLL